MSNSSVVLASRQPKNFSASLQASVVNYQLLSLTYTAGRERQLCNNSGLSALMKTLVIRGCIQMLLLLNAADATHNAMLCKTSCRQRTGHTKRWKHNLHAKLQHLQICRCIDPSRTSDMGLHAKELCHSEWLAVRRASKGNCK